MKRFDEKAERLQDSLLAVSNALQKAAEALQWAAESIKVWKEEYDGEGE